MNNYFYISSEKENLDSQELVKKIIKDGWVNSSTILVNCCPNYSSSLSQMINHKLSYLNKNELFECIPLETPYPNMSQIFNIQTQSYEMFDRYLIDWVRQYISPSFNYLFINSSLLTGKNFNKIKMLVRTKLDPSNYRFASLYMESSSIFKPDYYTQQFDKEKQGGLLFHWENAENPNWNY